LQSGRARGSPACRSQRAGQSIAAGSKGGEVLMNAGASSGWPGPRQRDRMPEAPRPHRDLNIMTSPFTLAACAEMLWRDKPIEWRCARLKELGFQVGLWNWPDHDLAKLEKS